MAKKSKPVEEEVKKKKKKAKVEVEDEGFPDLPWDEEEPTAPKKKKKVKEEEPAPKKKKKKEKAAEPEAPKKKKKDKEQTTLIGGINFITNPKKQKKSDAVIFSADGRDNGDITGVPKSKGKVVLPITVGKDDYIIVRVGSKCKLGFAHNPERNACYLEETLNSEEPIVFEYDEKTLLACLGAEPEIGTAFGVHIEPQRSETESVLGKLFYYRKMNKAEKKAFKWALAKALEVMKEQKFDSVLPIKRLEVRNKKGKYAGTYTIKRKGDDVQDKITFHPQVMEDPKYNLYVILHELAHALWFRKTSDEFRARWLVSYNEHTHVNKAKKSQLESTLKQLIESQVGIREFAKGLEDDEDKALFREILVYLKRHHKLSPQDVNLLLTHNSQVLGEIWPTSASLSESDQPITAYAATSVEEFFAEAVSHSLTGHKLPGKIDKLLQKTFKHIRGN